MKFFLDTAEVDEIKKYADTGLIDGVTTNPSLIVKSGRNIRDVIAEICEIISGDVSAEAIAVDVDGMVKEGKFLAQIASNVVVKLPLTPDGLKACYQLSQEGIKTNITLCFSAMQALLAAKAGATYISPFVGRIDDIGTDGMQLIADIREIYDNYGFETQILTASARHPFHVLEAAKIGSDVITIPAKVLEQLYKHPLTDKGLDAFLKDWKNSGQSIL